MTPYEYVQVVVTADQIKRAKENAAKIPADIKNSIRGGKGRQIGCLGEIVFADYFGGTVANTFNHDVLLKGKRCEVKTKERTVPPRGNYNATVAAANAEQRCDFYVFLSITLPKGQSFEEIANAYIMGAIKSSELKAKSTFYKKGQIEPGTNWDFKADCFNIAYERLTPPPKNQDASPACSSFQRRSPKASTPAKPDQVPHHASPRPRRNA